MGCASAKRQKAGKQEMALAARAREHYRYYADKIRPLEDRNLANREKDKTVEQRGRTVDMAVTAAKEGLPKASAMASGSRGTIVRRLGGPMEGAVGTTLARAGMAGDQQHDSMIAEGGVRMLALGRGISRDASSMTTQAAGWEAGNRSINAANSAGMRDALWAGAGTAAGAYAGHQYAQKALVAQPYRPAVPFGPANQKDWE